MDRPRGAAVFERSLLAGKSILVTGGGSGLGLAMATRFAELGGEVFISGRSRERLDAAAQTIRQATGRHVEAVTCDVRDADSVRACHDHVWQSKSLDILVNNAAASFVARTESLSARAADAVLAPTLHGALYNTLECGRRWVAAGRGGVVLCILSTSIVTGRAFAVPSAMGKAGLMAMIRSLAVEWGPKGIRLVGIAPGPFPTQAAMRQLRPDAAGAESYARVNPLGRVGEAVELANLASYLVSDQAGYINGEIVTIDGGMHLRTSGVEDLLGWTAEQWRSFTGRDA